MQVHGSIYRSIYHCATSVYRSEGLTAFYVSYPTTLSMTIPFTAIQFTAYESISKVLNPGKKYDVATHITAGGLAGAVAAAITTPLDVVKTLLQTRGTSRDLEIRHASGLWHAASIIYSRSGWTGFFRGLRPRVLTTMPSTAICWFVVSSCFLTLLRPPPPPTSPLASFDLATNLVLGHRMKWPRHISSAARTAGTMHLLDR